jgi:ribosomal protein S1
MGTECRASFTSQRVPCVLTTSVVTTDIKRAPSQGLFVHFMNNVRNFERMAEISRQSAGYKYNLKYSTSVVYSMGAEVKYSLQRCH